MAPFGRKPRIIIIKPAHHTANIKSGFNGVESMRRTRHARPVRSDLIGAIGSEVFGTFRKTQCQQSAGYGVHATWASSIPSLGTSGRVVINRVIKHIVGDFLNFIVILWTDIALYRSVLSRRHNRYLFLESNIGAIDKRHDLSISDASKITYSISNNSEVV